jgi:YegS/Rv2252/BmrU family lipid kinase
VPVPERRALVVVNPTRVRNTPLLEAQIHSFAAARGWWLDFLYTSAASDVPRIRARSGIGPPDLLLAAGGDGTVAEVVAAALEVNLPAGILPLGTANAVAAELGLPMHWEEAFDYALRRFPQTRAIDVARVNGRTSLLACGVGLDADIMRAATAASKRRLGRLAYLIAGIKSAMSPRLIPFELTLDGVVLRVDAAMVVVANVGTMGVPAFRFGPDIAIDDGLLDVCIYSPRNRRRRAGVALAIALGRHRRHGDIAYAKARSIRVRAPAEEWHEIDGDAYPGGNLDVDVLPQAVRMVA